ncbi:hypothetical protein F4054_08915 [Candidatus Poribacteria bacterium]|nr:hypothetical protein [Candidatus Poribacteria bacterium]MYK22369.1 hypothetical protein [Candidatus Poribacteria bacterium]
MAKKKGRRTTNVARKREKRNRDRKTRQKQLALEKQRRLPYEKSEEEHLHACISQSRELLGEPEFEGVHFDPILMHKRVMEVLEHAEIEPTDAPLDISEYLLESEEESINIVDEAGINADPSIVVPEAEEASDHFRLEVLPHLVTPDFMEKLTQALTACEIRLKRTGNRELAEVAFVTRSLFEAAPPEILAFHPMIQSIGIETLRALVEEIDIIIDGREDVKEILTDVLAQEDSETSESQPLSVFSNSGLDDAVESEPVESVPLDAETIETEEPIIEDSLSTSTEGEKDLPAPPVQSSEPEPPVFQVPTPSEIVPPPVTLSPDELPARALYKNFNGLDIKDNFEESTDGVSGQDTLVTYALVNETEEQIEFADVENERYITVTEEKLQLHARSEAELAIAMAEVEARCTSAVMYLATTVQERG